MGLTDEDGRFPRPWRLRPLDHKYYGTEFVAANGRVVPGLKIWLDADDVREAQPSEREDTVDEDGIDWTHYENRASFELAMTILDAVNLL